MLLYIDVCVSINISLPCCWRDTGYPWYLNTLFHGKMGDNGLLFSCKLDHDVTSLWQHIIFVCKKMFICTYLNASQSCLEWFSLAYPLSFFTTFLNICTNRRFIAICFPRFHCSNFLSEIHYYEGYTTCMITNIQLLQH